MLDRDTQIIMLFSEIELLSKRLKVMEEDRKDQWKYLHDLEGFWIKANRDKFNYGDLYEDKRIIK
jgi:hypothetical protein